MSDPAGRGLDARRVTAIGVRHGDVVRAGRARTRFGWKGGGRTAP